MLGYIIRRLAQGLIVILLVTIFIFLVMRFLPGDPLLIYLVESEITNMTPELKANIQHEYGLDKSLPRQYVDWIGKVARGNLGESIFYKVQVNSLVAERIPITLHLGILSMIFSGTVGVTFGVICALRRGRWIDSLFTFLANIGMTAPAFWIGMILIYFLSLKLDLLPVWGYTSPFTDFSLSFRQIIMPVFCLSLFSIASLTRQTRSSMLEVIRQDYIRTAWAKGLSERVIVTKHMIKNAMIPIITIFGMQVGNIFGGSVLIETVFNIPGMGRLMRDAVFAHDYQIVQAGILIISLMVVISNIAVDLSYGWVDPRIRYE
jgi:peptide/nickel transport system permease protein